MNNMEDYARFVVMAEDALLTKNISKMRWMGLEHTRQNVQREMRNLAYFTKEADNDPVFQNTRDTHYRTIQTGLNEMKEVIMNLRMDNELEQLIEKIVERTQSKASLEPFMEPHIYHHYCSGKPIEYLSLEEKRSTYIRLKSLVK
jgi:glutamate/tyrosine decarboxylase-like PLP-dependent enzyme